jgi:hypothetical protein
MDKNPYLDPTALRACTELIKVYILPIKMISVETLRSAKNQSSGKYSSIGAIKIMQKLNNEQKIAFQKIGIQIGPKDP